MGDWSSKVYEGIQAYTVHSEVSINKRTTAWLRAHAHYDDLHPYEAMELIKRLCEGQPAMQERAFWAAQEGLAYYEQALDACHQIHLEQMNSAP